MAHHGAHHGDGPSGGAERSASRPETGLRGRGAIAAVFGAGLLIQLWLLRRQWIGSDQAALLEVGAGLLRGDGLAATAKPMSGGARIPGALLELLTGAPLLLLDDYRAPSSVVLLFHVAAAGLLLAGARRVAAPRVALALFTLWWLSPWRLFHGSFLWEPNYLALPAAAHLWASGLLRPDRSGPAPPAEGRRSRADARARWLAGGTLGLVLVAGLQLHASVVVLWLLSLILIARGLIAPAYGPLAAGAALGALPLVPTLLAALGGSLPAVVPGAGVALGDRLLQGLVNLPKTALYWLRLGSADLGRRIRETMEPAAEVVAGPLQPPLPGGLVVLTSALAIATLLVAAWSTARWVRTRGERGGASAWLSSYAASGAGALLLAALLSPVTVQSWHVVVALPCALVPLALAAADGWRRRPIRWIGTAYVLAGLWVAVVVGLGHPWFRRPADPARATVRVGAGVAAGGGGMDGLRGGGQDAREDVPHVEPRAAPGAPGGEAPR